MESEVDEDSRVSSQELSQISYREYDESYETPQTFSGASVKGKYYKQTYREAWEHMPDFKGK